MAGGVQSQHQVKSIHNMFAEGTDITQSVVQGVFDANKGDQSKTIETLLEFTGAVNSPQEEQKIKQQEQKKKEEEEAARAKILRDRELQDIERKIQLLEQQKAKDLQKPDDRLNMYRQQDSLRMSQVQEAIRSIYSQEHLKESLPMEVYGKGLRNNLGENNCFLNVVIQSLYAIKPFINQFKNCKRHIHNPNYCVFCAFKIIFTHYEFGQNKQLPPTVLRDALAGLYHHQSRFQIGKYDDAAEAYDALLTNLHHVIVGMDKDKETGKEIEKECVPSCFVHSTLSLDIHEYVKCNHCGQRSQPLKFKEFIHYVSGDAICQANSLFKSFGELISMVTSDSKPCPNSECNFSEAKQTALGISSEEQLNNHLKVSRKLNNNPHVFAVGIIWQSPNAPVEQIRKIMDVINREIALNQVFDEFPGENRRYGLRSIICYYGHHYITHIWNKKTSEWITFDDISVKRVSTNWQDLVTKCCDGRYQPFLLLYEPLK